MLLGGIMLLTTVSTGQAKRSFDRVLAYAGLNGCAQLDDPRLQDFFSFSDFQVPAAWPAAPGEGVLVTRYFEDAETGTLSAFDKLWLYPPVEGRGPFVYYAGLVNGSSEYDGKLYLADRAAWDLLQQSLAHRAEPVTNAGTIAGYLAAGLTGIHLGGTAGMLIGRGRRPGRSAA